MAILSVPPTEREQPPRLLALGSVFFWGAALLLIVGLLTALVIGWGGEDHFTDADAARVLERQKILQDRVTEDYKYLHDKPSWFKKDAGLVRVPIDEAMAMTLTALQTAKPHPAYPIAQSPPQNSGAPTSPDKGAGQDAKTAGKTNDNNPPASNPTVGQPSPAPVVAQTPAPATAASNAPAATPLPVPAPASVSAPAAAPVPTPSAAPAVNVTPTPAATATPYTSAGPTANNNANNPGTPPIPGKEAQPAAPPAATNTSGPVATATPAASGAQPAPLTNPPAQPTPEVTASPASAATPIPNQPTPGITPASTP